MRFVLFIIGLVLVVVGYFMGWFGDIPIVFLIAFCYLWISMEIGFIVGMNRFYDVEDKLDTIEAQLKEMERKKRKEGKW